MKYKIFFTRVDSFVIEADSFEQAKYKAEFLLDQQHEENENVAHFVQCVTLLKDQNHLQV